MKKIIFIVFLAILLVLCSSYQKTIVKADELFGIGTIKAISIRSVSLGWVSAYGKWIIIEHATSNTTAQCLIVPITKTLSDSRPVYCEKFYKPNRLHFTGFIYFRGHERPFCGGKDIPENNCLKIGEVTHG